MDVQAKFEAIRDLPYKIPLTLEDTSVDCDKKHKLLEEMLTKEGFTTRYRVCAFLWSEQNLPSEVISLPHEDRCEHLYLEVLRDGVWKVIDITWDSRLKGYFPICEWDADDTTIALKPLEVYPPEYQKPLVHNESEENFLEDIRKSGLFYKALNEWLEQIRN